jgi:two-component system, OmpR family, sensor histidine kinase SenX3
MRVSTRNKSIAFFISFCVCLVTLAVALNVGWILLSWREVAILTLGLIFFGAIITGLVLNTIFLVREIRRNDQHDSFINAVTHELKTPITSIKLYLDTLKSRDLSESQRQEFYDRMLVDTDRLMRTVEQVLRAGQLGHRLRRPEKRPVNLSDLIERCVQTVITRYAVTDREIQFSRPAASAIVPGDEEQLETAITNLVDNAVKYSAEKINIKIDLVTNREAVAIRVEDKGIGIHRSQLKHVFRRFYRVPGQVMMRVKGTGLGLFIVQAIARSHGGRVYAHSEGEGRGSTFILELPKI